MAEKIPPVAADVQPDTATNALTPATTVHPSGAMVEPGVLTSVDADHPAIDNNPRSNVPEHSYRIDLNDPTMDGQTAVRKNLEAQGSAAGGKSEVAQPAPAAASAPKA